MNLKRRDRAYENARRGPFRAAERPVLEGLDPLELFVRQTLGPHTDVWGLGVTLYEALTGHEPYNFSDFSDLRRLIESTEPALPSSTNSAIPHELDRICLKCLSKNPEERYSNAGLLAADLRTWQQNTQPRKQRRVFVSHSTKDRDFVEREIISQLEKTGSRHGILK